MIRLAVRSALSDRAASGDVIVVNDWSFEQPKTRDAQQRLAAIGAEGRVLLVLPRDEANAWLSFSNLPRVHALQPDQLNCYDIMVSDVVVFPQACLPSSTASPPSKTAASPPSKQQAEASA